RIANDNGGGRAVGSGGEQVGGAGLCREAACGGRGALKLTLGLSGSGPFQPTPPGRPAGALPPLRVGGRLFTAGRKVEVPCGGTIKRGSSLSRPPALGRARPSHRLGAGEGGNPFRQRSSGPSPPTPPGRQARARPPLPPGGPSFTVSRKVGVTRGGSIK